MTDPRSFTPRLATRGSTGRATADLVPGLRLRRVRRRTRRVALLGLRVDVDVSCVFGLGLAAWSFADAALPVHVPGRSLAAYALAGSVAAVLVLGSLLVHEGGHWLAARRAALPVTRMSLTLVGGRLELGGAPSTPATELRLAIAGPAASLLLATLAATAHVALVELDVDPLAAAVAAAVAVANVAIGLLNLLPGLPLDGGRFLKAAVWALTADEARGDDVARGAGRALAVTLLLLAVIASASGDAAAAIWSGALGLTIVRG